MTDYEQIHKNFSKNSHCISWTMVLGIISCCNLWRLIYFPFYISNGIEMPYHRLVSLRVTILLTFSYYSFKYLISESRQLYPIQFLDTILKIYFCSALAIGIRFEMAASEFALLFVFLLIAIVTHIVSRPKLRRYYYSKFSD